MFDSPNIADNLLELTPDEQEIAENLEKLVATIEDASTESNTRNTAMQALVRAVQAITSDITVTKLYQNEKLAKYLQTKELDEHWQERIKKHGLCDADFSFMPLPTVPPLKQLLSIVYKEIVAYLQAQGKEIEKLSATDIDAEEKAKALTDLQKLQNKYVQKAAAMDDFVAQQKLLQDAIHQIETKEVRVDTALTSKVLGFVEKIAEVHGVMGLILLVRTHLTFFHHHQRQQNNEEVKKHQTDISMSFSEADDRHKEAFALATKKSLANNDLHALHNGLHNVPFAEWLASLFPKNAEVKSMGSLAKYLQAHGIHILKRNRSETVETTKETDQEEENAQDSNTEGMTSNEAS